MATLVTLQQAIDHLRLPMQLGSPIDPEEAALQLKLDAAEAQVLDYVKDQSLWPTASSPVLQAAILLQCAELWRFRGDDLEDPQREHPGGLSPVVEALLYRWRRPVFA